MEEIATEQVMNWSTAFWEIVIALSVQFPIAIFIVATVLGSLCWIYLRLEKNVFNKATASLELLPGLVSKIVASTESLKAALDEALPDYQKNQEKCEQFMTASLDDHKTILVSQSELKKLTENMVSTFTEKKSLELEELKEIKQLLQGMKKKPHDFQI